MFKEFETPFIKGREVTSMQKTGTSKIKQEKYKTRKKNKKKNPSLVSGREASSFDNSVAYT